MKPMKKKITRFFVLLILIAHSPNSIAQLDRNANIVQQFSFGEEFEVFKNIKKNTFFITDENKNIIIKKLKYCERLNQSYIQAINKKNVPIYYNDKLEIIEKPKYVGITVCGNGDINHKLDIVNKQGKYLINLTTIQSFEKTDSIKSVLDSINDYEINNIYFVNKKRTYKYIDNTMSDFEYPKFVIFEKGEKYGILDQGVTYIFDQVIINLQYVKIKNNNLWNYYHISPIPKFKRLDSFVFGLAYFELPNGKIGYIDKQGTEYYK